MLPQDDFDLPILPEDESIPYVPIFDDIPPSPGRILPENAIADPLSPRSFILKPSGIEDVYGLQPGDEMPDKASQDAIRARFERAESIYSPGENTGGYELGSSEAAALPAVNAVSAFIQSYDSLCNAAADNNGKIKDSAQLSSVIKNGAELMCQAFPTVAKACSTNTEFLNFVRNVQQAEAVSLQWKAARPFDGDVRSLLHCDTAQAAKHFYEATLDQCRDKELPRGVWSKMELAKAISAAEDAFTHKAGGIVFKPPAVDEKSIYAPVQELGSAKNMRVKNMVDIISGIVQSEIEFVGRFNDRPPVFNSDDASRRATGLSDQLDGYHKMIGIAKKLAVLLSDNQQQLSNSVAEDTFGVYREIRKLNINRQENGIV